MESLARPNGNTTGISILNAELDGKRQEILIEAVPGIRRMAALADSSMLTETKARALQDAARVRNIDLSIYRIARGNEIAAAIDTAHASGATALNVFASPMLFGKGRMIMERGAALRGASNIAAALIRSPCLRVPPRSRGFRGLRCQSKRMFERQS